MQMDLPLAWRRPAPPDRVRHGMHPAPSSTPSRGLRHLLPAPQSTRPLPHFIRKHTNRQKNLLCALISLRATYCQQKNDFHRKISAFRPSQLLFSSSTGGSRRTLGSTAFRSLKLPLLYPTNAIHFSRSCRAHRTIRAWSPPPTSPLPTFRPTPAAPRPLALPQP